MANHCCSLYFFLKMESRGETLNTQNGQTTDSSCCLNPEVNWKFPHMWAWIPFCECLSIKAPSLSEGWVGTAGDLWGPLDHCVVFSRIRLGAICSDGIWTNWSVFPSYRAGPTSFNFPAGSGSRVMGEVVPLGPVLQSWGPFNALQPAPARGGGVGTPGCRPPWGAWEPQRNLAVSSGQKTGGLRGGHQPWDLGAMTRHVSLKGSGKLSHLAVPHAPATNISCGCFWQEGRVLIRFLLPLSP